MNVACCCCCRMILSIACVVACSFWDGFYICRGRGRGQDGKGPGLGLGRTGGTLFLLFCVSRYGGQAKARRGENKVRVFLNHFLLDFSFLC
ncbi:hypothetical protein HDK64DRAFT_278528 [Phyllosticta capitalensis]|uniref:Secreted protein n=1 Tax=Phyllosticta capitalensis TaxID=121624 RepID=A0ABR1YF92_9PEZI